MTIYLFKRRYRKLYTHSAPIEKEVVITDKKEKKWQKLYVTDHNLLIV